MTRINSSNVYIFTASPDPHPWPSEKRSLLAGPLLVMFMVIGEPETWRNKSVWVVLSETVYEFGREKYRREVGG